MTAPAATASLARAFDDHRGRLWRLAFRLTGCAADADDVVQETFRRALESPPPDLARPLAPWLLRVSTRVAIDHLRRRREVPYDGPWLPSPVALDRLEPEPDDPEVRYGRAESLTTAFLLALEVLTPAQRAALVLRDVLGCSGQEVARALGVTPGNARVLLHRARQQLAPYDEARCVPDPELVRRHADALTRFLAAVASGDVAAVMRLLAPDAEALQDAAGERKAARRCVSGAARVARLYVGLARKTPPPLWADLVMLSGLPAVVVVLPPRPRRMPTHLTLAVELDALGRIRRVLNVMATRKLTAVPLSQR